MGVLGSLPGMGAAKLLGAAIKMPAEITTEASLVTAIAIGTWVYTKHRQASIDGWLAARLMVATGRRPFEERDLPTKCEANIIRARAEMAPSHM